MTNSSRATIERLLDETDWVRRLAARLVRGEANADDLAQETLTIALRRPPAPDRPLRPWLATVARNLARTRRKGEGNRAAREGEAARPEATPRTPERLAVEVELQEELSALVRALGREERDAILLRYHEGLSAVEIGRRLGVPAGTVRSRLKRGLDRLRGQLDSRWDGDRRGWMAALTPLAAPRGSAGKPAAAAAAIDLTLWAKLSAAAVVVGALGYAGVRLGGSAGGGPGVAPPTETRRADVETAADATGGAALADAAPSRVPSESEANGRDVAAGAPEGAGPLTRVTLRAVDGDGAPVAGASVRVEPGLAALDAAQERFEAMDPISRAAALARLAGTTGAAGAATLESDLLLVESRLSVVVTGPRNGETRREAVAAPGDDLDLGDVVLTPRTRLAGTLVDPAGAPVSGEVALFDAHGEERAVASTWAATDGEFEVFVERDGDWEVRGRVARSEQWGPPVSAGRLALGETWQGEVAAADLRRTLEVLVADADGAPVAARLRYRIERDGAALQSGLVTTDSNGLREIDLAGARGGTIVIDVKPTAGAHAPERIERGAHPGAIEVVVHASPREPRTLVLTGADGPLEGAVRTRGFGSFDVAPLSGRTVELSVPTDPRAEFTAWIEVEGMVHVELGQADLLARPDESEVQLTPLPGITGLVTAGGEPVSRARLRVSHRTDAGEWERTAGAVGRVRWQSGHDGRADDAGRFRLPLAYQGEWVMEVSAEGWAPALVDLSGFVPSEGRTDLEVELVRPGRVHGTVRGADGAPRSRALLIAQHADHRPVRTRADSDGRYALELAPGEWTITAPVRDIEGWGVTTVLDVGDGWTLPGGVAVTSGGDVRYDVAPPRRESVALAILVDGAPAAGGAARAELADDDPLLQGPGEWRDLAEDGTVALDVATDAECVVTARVDGVDGLMSTRGDARAIAGTTPWRIDPVRVSLRGSPGANRRLRVVAGPIETVRHVAFDADGRTGDMTLPAGRLEVRIDGHWRDVATLSPGTGPITVE